MADAVASNVIFKGQDLYVVQLTCLSDGTGETGVTKINLSTLTTFAGIAPTYSALEEAQWDIQGFTEVKLYWDHTTPQTMKLMSGRGNVSYKHVSYLFDNQSAGGTGNILLTSAGAANGATYDITVALRLRPQTK